MLKQIIKTGLPILAIALLAACGNTSQPAEDSTHTHMEETPAAAAAAPVQLKDPKAQAVYQHYVHLTTALINSDSNEAKIAGAAIEAGAKELPQAAAIAQSAQQVAQAPTLEAQRAQYMALSNNIITLIKNTGLNSGELYVDFCPMANNGKGAQWIAASKEIKNPYYGDEMMTCGEVKDTIK